MKRNRSTLKKHDAITRVDSMVAAIDQDVEIAMLLDAALEAGNAVVHELKGEKPALNFYGAHCYEAIRLGLILSLALTLAKLFDPAKLFVASKRKGKRFGRSRSPNDSDIVSIPLLIRLLKQKRCRSAMGQRARGWTPQLEDMESANEATALEALDAAVADYDKFRRGHAGRRAARVLKDFRNKRLAHSLLRKPPKTIPRFGDLSHLLEVAMIVISNARLAVFGKNLDIEDIREERRRQSRFFWEPAIKSVIEFEAGK
ncbi:MAG: hypothetical protein ACLQJL_11435 [Roseiarcus sp.]